MPEKVPAISRRLAEVLLRSLDELSEREVEELWLDEAEHRERAWDVRTNRGTSPEWAAMLRRNLMELDEFPAVKFFLIATPDRIYIWKDALKGSALIPPAYVIDAQALLKPYFEGAKVDVGEITDPAFELPEEFGKRQSWLEDSGFLEVIKDGRVEFAAAA